MDLLSSLLMVGWLGFNGAFNTDSVISRLGFADETTFKIYAHLAKLQARSN